MLTLLIPGGAEVISTERDAAASLMPAGLDEGQSDQQFADLLEWLVR